MTNTSQIIATFYANELKTILKEMEDYFREKSTVLPLDAIFKIVIGSETEIKTNKQKELTLQLASQWDGTDEEFNRIVEEHLKDYLKIDSNYIYFRKRHKAIEEGKEIIKEIFSHKIVNDYYFLKGTGETYEEITLSAMPNKEETEKLINREIELYKKLIAFIEDNRGIVDVPGIIRTDIIDAVTILYEKVMEHLVNVVERIYSSQ